MSHQKLELRHADVLDVAQRTGLEVVDADDVVAAAQQLVAQMRPQEPRATGDKAGGHRWTLANGEPRPIEQRVCALALARGPQCASS